MKMLLLDVKNGEVKVVEANTLEDYRKFIGCRYIDIVRRWIGDVVVEIVTDDEGAIIDNTKVSAIGVDRTPMLYGNLLIASGRVTDDGELTEINGAELDELMDNIATITTSVYTEPYPVFVEVDY